MATKKRLEFEITAGPLKDTVDILKEVTTEAQFVFGSEGVTVKVVDISHVAMISLTLDKASFEGDWPIGSEDEYDAGVSLTNMSDFLRLAKRHDRVALVLDLTDHTLGVSFGMLSRRMALLDTSSMTVPSVPKVSLPATVTLSTAELRRAVKAVKSVADIIELELRKAGLALQGEGDTDSVVMDIDSEDLTSVELSDDDTSYGSMYSLDYFEKLARAAGKSDTVSIGLGNDFPCTAKFALSNDSGSVTFMLAPRITD